MVRKTNKRSRSSSRKTRRSKSKSRSRSRSRSRKYGGSTNLDVLPKEYYYQYNSNPVNTNPLNTNTLSGGKRKRLRGCIGAFGPAYDLQNVNTIIGTSDIVNENITHQPASTLFPANLI